MSLLGYFFHGPSNWFGVKQVKASFSFSANVVVAVVVYCCLTWKLTETGRNDRKESWGRIDNESLMTAIRLLRTSRKTSTTRQVASQSSCSADRTGKKLFLLWKEKGNRIESNGGIASFLRRPSLRPARRPKEEEERKKRETRRGKKNLLFSLIIHKCGISHRRAPVPDRTSSFLTRLTQTISSLFSSFRFHTLQDNNNYFSQGLLLAGCCRRHFFEIHHRRFQHLWTRCDTPKVPVCGILLSRSPNLWVGLPFQKRIE